MSKQNIPVVGAVVGTLVVDGIVLVGVTVNRKNTLAMMPREQTSKYQ